MEPVLIDFLSSDLENPVERERAIKTAAAALFSSYNPLMRELAAFFQVSVGSRLGNWHRRIDQLRAIAETDPNAPSCRVADAP
ncbi:MAG: hypothetical protein QM723_30025 [Myxococcaceae bacterium]